MKRRKFDKPSTPAEKAISAFGGVRALGRAIGRNGSSISRWTKPREDGGTGGRVPTSIQAELLAEARRQGLDLTAEDLISWGE